MEGEGREPRRTRSTVSLPPVNQNGEDTLQDTTMTGEQDRFHSKITHNYDLRYWPSKIAPEKPSRSPIRNYLLSDSPPYKIELPGELRTVMQYFDTEYKSVGHAKLLHVHIGTGEILLSEILPGTRRLVNKWLEGWLGIVHNTLVQFQPGNEGAVGETTEPHPDDNLFPMPRPSHVWGSDFPGLRPCPRASSPNRDDILEQHFQNLRKEKNEHRQETRSLRQDKTGKAHTEGVGALGGDNDRAGPNPAKVSKSKKQRLKKALAKKQAEQAANSLEHGNEMTGGEPNNDNENQGPNSSGHGASHNVQDPSDTYVYPAIRTPLAKLVERHPKRTPATGVNNLPVRERPTVSPITPIDGESNAHNVNTPINVGSNAFAVNMPINGGSRGYAVDTPANVGSNAHAFNTPVANLQGSYRSHGNEAQDIEMNEDKPEIKVYNDYDELDTAEDEY